MSPKSSQEPPKIPPRGSRGRAESLQDRLRSLQIRKKNRKGSTFSKINALGRILAALCVPQAQLSCFWEPLGRSQATFPAIWGACRALRTHFGAPFRRHSCTVPACITPSKNPAHLRSHRLRRNSPTMVRRSRVSVFNPPAPRGQCTEYMPPLSDKLGEVYPLLTSPTGLPRPPKYLPL